MITNNHKDGNAKNPPFISNRSSNIDLLRVLAIIAVIIIHYNNDDIGGGYKYVEPRTINQFVLYLIESLCVSAVNVFVILSGYCSYKRECLSLAKPIRLLITLYSFRLSMLFFSVFISHENFSLYDIFVRLLPTNWYITLFIVLSILSPWLNMFYRNMGQYSKQFLLVLIVLFSIWPTSADVVQCITGVQKNDMYGVSSIGLYGSMDGYTIVNFVLLYMIGLSIRSNRPMGQSIKSITTKLLIVIAILVSWAYLYPLTGLRLHKSAWSYCNPLLIYEAYLLVVLFLKINLPPSKFISYLAKGTLTVYIVHSSFLVRIDTSEAVNSSTLYMLGHLAVTTLAVFVACMCIHVVWNFATRRLWRFLDTKKYNVKIQ